MEKYVTILEQKLKVSQEVHSLISSSRSSTSRLFLCVDTRKTRDDGVKLPIAGIYVFEFPVFLVQLLISYFAIEQTD